MLRGVCVMLLEISYDISAAGLRSTCICHLHTADIDSPRSVRCLQVAPCAVCATRQECTRAIANLQAGVVSLSLFLLPAPAANTCSQDAHLFAGDDMRSLRAGASQECTRAVADLQATRTLQMLGAKAQTQRLQVWPPSLALNAAREC